MTSIRLASVAGSWYPGSADALAAEIDRHLAAVGERPSHLRDVTAIVSPHAGLMYSGPVAAHAYRAVQGCEFDVAVLVGPSHFVGFDGVAVYRSGGFATPLGVAPIDEACASAMLAAPVMHDDSRVHAREHSLEMQLPFLQRVAPRTPIVPLLMGHQTMKTAHALAFVLAQLLKNRKALLIASTDLSHYHDAPTAARLDAIVIDAIDQFDSNALQVALEIRPEHACGGGPTMAVMLAARMLGATEAAVLKYADSGDVSGDKSSVVGYLAAAIGTSRAAP